MTESPPIFCARCDREPEVLMFASDYHALLEGPDHWVCGDCGEAIGKAANAAVNEEVRKLWEQ